MSTTTTHRILTDAADLLERCGWTQGAYVSNGGYCLMGAFHEANSGAISEQYEEAWAFLEEAVGNPIHWNDEDGRTKEEVLNLLRTTATAAEVAA